MVRAQSLRLMTLHCPWSGRDMTPALIADAWFHIHSTSSVRFCASIHHPYLFEVALHLPVYHLLWCNPSNISSAFLTVSFLPPFPPILSSSDPLHSSSACVQTSKVTVFYDTGLLWLWSLLFVWFFTLTATLPDSPGVSSDAGCQKAYWPQAARLKVGKLLA